jgi:hypothetical protein
MHLGPVSPLTFKSQRKVRSSERPILGLCVTLSRFRCISWLIQFLTQSVLSDEIYQFLNPLLLHSTTRHPVYIPA